MSKKSSGKWKKLLLTVIFSQLGGCVQTLTPTTSTGGNTEPSRPTPAPTPVPVPENPLHCYELNPRETSDEEAVAFPGQWFVTAQKILPGGKISDAIIAETQSSFMGIATLCLKKADLDAPILLTATHSVFPATPFTLRRLLTQAPAPIATPTPTLSAQTAPLTMDILVTHLTDVIMDIYELPFSGSVARVSPQAFASIEAVLRDDSTVKDGLEDFSLTQAQVREAWNEHINSISGIAQGRTCLTSPFPADNLSGGSAYTFPGGLPEDFPKGNDTSLDTDGSLFELAGIELDDMTVTVNGVDLNAAPFDSYKKVAGDLSGALMTANDFDPAGDLRAEFSMVNIHNAYDEDVMVPCVAGFLTIENESSDDDELEAGSSICIDAVDAGDLFQIPSNGALGDSPDDDTQFMVFGDDGDGNAWVLGAPGIRDGTQEDIIQFTVTGEQVCIELADNHDFDADADEDTASLFWYLCVVEGGNETYAAARVNSSGRGLFDVGTRPALFGEADLDEREIAEQIGRSDFMFNPDVITFMEEDIRDSLINHYNGNQPNVFFSGNGLDAKYDVTLNGEGNSLASIVTGPEGQWSGAIAIDNAALGGFLRFSEDDGDLESGHHFDLPIAETCMPAFQ